MDLDEHDIPEQPEESEDASSSSWDQDQEQEISGDEDSDEPRANKRRRVRGDARQVLNEFRSQLEGAEGDPGDGTDLQKKTAATRYVPHKNL